MGKRILVVDDEKDLVETIKLKLTSEGYEVDEAFDGKQALEKVKQRQPDLILLDVMMPQVNGYQVCRELKKSDKFKQIPVVMLTAKAQESDKFWGMETGADDYVTKPFEFDALLSSIKKLLS
jgi:DNA-binding response OmpR family regulator